MWKKSGYVEKKENYGKIKIYKYKNKMNKNTKEKVMHTSFTQCGQLYKQQVENFLFFFVFMIKELCFMKKYGIMKKLWKK